MPPAADQVDRFRRDVAALSCGPPERLGLAVSGGPDSLALLLLAAAAYPRRVQAATVDHGLRAESAGEAAFAARISVGLGVPHDILAAKVDTTRASLQQSAREARYAALAAWMKREAIPLLATAHHLDDQAETLLMRLLRGAGLPGLSGVRASSAIVGASVIRPLLGWRRAELRAVVEEAGIVAIDDPSNADPRFDRVRFRHLLAESPWLDPAPLARSAAALAQAEEALAWAAARLWEERVSRQSGVTNLDPAGLPPELIRRLLLRMIESYAAAPPPRGEEVQRLAATLSAGGSATLAGLLCRGGEHWTFEPAPPRRR